MSEPLNFFLIAGELSGDRLGASLIDGLNEETGNNISVQGVGGPMMEEAGMRSMFPIADLSVMGIMEVLPRIPKLLGRIKQTADAIIQAQPDALITIDSPDFTMRVAERVKAALPNLIIIHYVAPSVWAWRPERAEKMSKYVNHVLALLPFEPRLMTKAGMSCDYVGHPVIDEPRPSRREELSLAAELQLDRHHPIVTLLPGSRVGEIHRMAPIFGEVVNTLYQRNANIQFVLPVASSVVDSVQKYVGDWKVKPKMLSPNGIRPAQVEARKRAIYSISDAAVATSGTVALELAAQNCPMIVAYKANWLTTRMVKKMARIDTANLVNIISETRVVPEFLFEECTSANITSALSGLLQDEDLRLQQENAMEKTIDVLGLGEHDSALRAARSVLSFIGQSD